MTQIAKFQMAVELINDLIEKTNKRWAGEDELRIYAWGWRNDFTLSSLHGTHFYHMEDIIHICRALGLDYTLTVGDNLDGVPTPFVSIF